jgi:L-xylulose reductase
MQPVDFVVNNAGVALLEDFLDIDFSKWDQTMAVNLRAAAVISQECARKMIESGISGTIVNVSSQAAYRALPGHTSYCVSKAALDHLTRMMALELGPKGIRINSVNPTVVLTDMGRKAWEDPEKSSKMLSRIPLRKFAQVDDVVNVVMFLLSDLSNMVHGAVIPVDGGFSVG